MSSRSETFRRVQESHATLAGRMDEVSGLFYERLFEKHPVVRALFPTDMSKMLKHFAVGLSLICRNLQNFDALERPLMELGAQHAGFGARPEHYPIVCAILVESLRETSERVGLAWDPRLELDWTTVLDEVAQRMLKGAAMVVDDAPPAVVVASRSFGPRRSEGPGTSLRRAWGPGGSASESGNSGSAV
ncbi:MAG: globin domain-containing protein [Phycisphaerales bacterium]